ncbi:hypothetical protein C8R43DRAFT_1047717 [Mycena crocata]|nr:hypothetical protein C8R43DRAFT_1047717 [Mycena crocata]
MIDVVEGLQEEVAANTDCGKCDALEVERTKLEEKFETTIAGFRERALEFEKTMMNEADAKYRQYMKALPLPENRPPFAQLDPVCCRDNNLHAYISQDPNAKSFLNHILYLPKRTIRMFDFHYVCFGPTQQYDRVTKQWTKGSDLTSLHRGTRELFINAKEFIFYAGTYRCHDLRPLFPKGSVPHAHVSVPEIRDAALGVPLPPDHRSIIEKCYPDGKIKVEATGLQCIGFNVQLYDSLRRRFAKDCTGNDTAKEIHATEGKRKAEDESNPVGKKQKA